MIGIQHDIINLLIICYCVYSSSCFVEKEDAFVFSLNIFYNKRSSCQAWKQHFCRLKRLWKISRFAQEERF